MEVGVLGEPGHRRSGRSPGCPGSRAARSRAKSAPPIATTRPSGKPSAPPGPARARATAWAWGRARVPSDRRHRGERDRAHRGPAPRSNLIGPLSGEVRSPPTIWARGLHQVLVAETPSTVPLPAGDAARTAVDGGQAEVLGDRRARGTPWRAGASSERPRSCPIPETSTTTSFPALDVPLREERHEVRVVPP